MRFKRTVGYYKKKVDIKYSVKYIKGFRYAHPGSCTTWRGWSWQRCAKFQRRTSCWLGWLPDKGGVFSSFSFANFVLIFGHHAQHRMLDLLWSWQTSMWWRKSNFLFLSIQWWSMGYSGGKPMFLPSNGTNRTFWVFGGIFFYLLILCKNLLIVSNPCLWASEKEVGLIQSVPAKACFICIYLARLCFFVVCVCVCAAETRWPVRIHRFDEWILPAAT